MPRSSRQVWVPQSLLLGVTTVRFNLTTLTRLGLAATLSCPIIGVTFASHSPGDHVGSSTAAQEVVTYLLSVNAALPQGETVCPSSAFAEAWGRESKSGLFTLCRIPAESAGMHSLEYELRSGTAVLWRVHLTHVLDDAVVTNSGVVVGFGNEKVAEDGSVPVYVASVGIYGQIVGEWSIKLAPRAGCTEPTPKIVSIASVDENHIAIVSNFDELMVLDARAPDHVRRLDLTESYGKVGEIRWLAECKVMPQADIVVLRIGYRAIKMPESQFAQTELGSLAMVMTVEGHVLWNSREVCNSIPMRQGDRDRAFALIRQFESERDARLTVMGQAKIGIQHCPSGSSVIVSWEKSVDGSFRVTRE